MIPADWFIPDGVKLAFTQRHGGVSLAPFDSLNLGLHVGDNPDFVHQNRAILKQKLELTAEPAWLQQCHGTDLIDLDNDSNRVADGSYCKTSQQVCVVMSADCLPVLICDRRATQVCAVHAGWRGLCDGIVEAGLDCFEQPAVELVAYLGASIGADSFEVGNEVRQQFIKKQPALDDFFKPRGEKYLADVQAIAAFKLTQFGVKTIYRLPHDTYSRPDDYFSYRRDSHTGRMASLIWLA